MVHTTTYGGARIRYNSDAYEDYRGADTDPSPADMARAAAADLRRARGDAIVARDRDALDAARRAFAAADEALDADITVDDDASTGAEWAACIDAAADAWEEANGLWAPEEVCDYDD